MLPRRLLNHSIRMGSNLYAYAVVLVECRSYRKVKVTSITMIIVGACTMEESMEIHRPLAKSDLSSGCHVFDEGRGVGVGVGGEW